MAVNHWKAAISWTLVLGVVVSALCITNSLNAQFEPDEAKPAAIDRERAQRAAKIARFRRPLMVGKTSAKLKTIERIRLGFLDDVEATELITEYLVSKLPEQINRGDVDTVSLMCIETLGGSAHTDEARQKLIEWSNLAMGSVDAPAVTIEGTLIKDIDVVFQCLMMALRHYRHDEVREFAEVLVAHDDYRIQILAIDLIGRQQHPEAIKLLRPCAESEYFRRYYGYRHAVIDATLRVPSPESIALLESMKPKLDGLLLRLVNGHLAIRAKNQDQRGIRELVIVNTPLRGAASSTDEASTTYSTVLHEGAKVTRQNYRAPKFFGIPIYADRVTFVIDFSSTMRERLASGRTRLEQAKIELANAIAQLEPNQAFRVIGFDADVVSMTPTLVEASPQQKQRFIRELALLQNGRGTNIYGGLTAAIQDTQQPEMIIILSDGLPTVGEITLPQGILRAIDYQNLFKRIMISTVVIGPKNPLMQQLAARSGGETRRVR